MIYLTFALAFCSLKVLGFNFTFDIYFSLKCLFKKYYKGMLCFLFISFCAVSLMYFHIGRKLLSKVP